MAGEELWWFENNHIQEILKNKTMLLRHNGDCEECNNFVSFQIIKRNENLNKYMPAMIKQKIIMTETTITLYQHNVLKYSLLVIEEVRISTAFFGFFVVFEFLYLIKHISIKLRLTSTDSDDLNTFLTNPLNNVI